MSVAQIWSMIKRSCNINEQDELLWGATWLHKATQNEIYLNYVLNNVYQMGRPWNIGEFRWDSKDAEISVLLSEVDYDFLIKFHIFFLLCLTKSHIQFMF